jgi:uracil-DNA glycosylase
MLSYKILLVGQAPSRSAGKLRAFDGESGRRLAKHLGIAWERFYDYFETVNLIRRWPGKWGGALPYRAKGDRFPPRTAKRRAKKIEKDFVEFSAVVFCGRKVAAASGHRREFLKPFLTATGQVAVVLPHPSGCNIWWNSASNRRMACRTLLYMNAASFECVLREREAA